MVKDECNNSTEKGFATQRYNFFLNYHQNMLLNIFSTSIQPISFLLTPVWTGRLSALTYHANYLAGFKDYGGFIGENPSVLLARSACLPRSAQY